MYESAEAIQTDYDFEQTKTTCNLTEKFVTAVETQMNPKQAEEAVKTFQNVNDYVLAPALNGFVLWTLRQALNSGKKRLYFLARDGYFMYRAAQIYCEKLNLPIECRYLSCSRYSIRIPMFHLDMNEALGYICRGGIDVTMTKILNRAGIDAQEQQKVLENPELHYEKDTLIPYAELEHIKNVLKEDTFFINCVEQHSREAMPNLEGYLIQEGLFDGTPSALVDSGWVGSMQKVLHQLMAYMEKQNASIHQNSLEGYYWGLYELPEQVNPKEYHCYYFSPGENLRGKVYFSNCLFEGIFSAPHGMTLSYSKSNGRFSPVYAEISKEQQNFMYLTEQRMLEYTEKMAAAMDMEHFEKLDSAKDRETIRRLLELFMGEPTTQEAELYGSLHFSDDVLDYGGHQMAEPMSQEELTANHLWHKALAMFGIQKKHVKESAWYEGSAVRSGIGVKRHLHRYAGYKYLLYLRKKRLWRKIYG